jgi:uncharacterized protein (TIGR03546 family)
MDVIKAIAKLVAALNGNTGRNQIAAGFSWGLLLALIPLGNFFWIVIFVVSFFFRHNHGGKMLAMALLKLLSPLLYPLVVDPLGWEILHTGPLQGVFTTLYNTPLVPFTGFNNTLVAGGLVLGLALFVPAFFLLRGLIPLYRNTLLPRLLNTRLVKALSTFQPLVRFMKLVSAFENDTGGV